MSLPEFDAAIAFLGRAGSFVVTSHVNGDGDSIGSCLAMADFLSGKGKSATVILNDVPDRFDFLPGFDEIQRADEREGMAADAAVVLDCPSLDRIGSVGNCLGTGTAILNIDHHKGNRYFGIANLVSEEVSSTCELLFHLFAAMDLKIDAPLAEKLYTGILFDTGSFRYSLTTSRSHEAAAQLIRCGARLDFVADRLYNNRSLGEIKLLGKAVESLSLHGEGRIALLHLSHSDMRMGDPEEAVNYGMMIKGVEVAALLKEEKPGQFRVSLRSRSEVDVSAVASRLGGGGHERAAGCRRQGDLAAVTDAVIGEIEKVLA